MSIIINAETRNSNTKSDLRKLREDGRIPGSISGKKLPPVSIAIDEKQLMQLLNGHSHEIIQMDIPGTSFPFL